jgi:outer membrane lipopolysaccharide assembly protein LptE/RlpB
VRIRGGFALLLAAISLLTGCGYHVGGQANLLPKELHSIAVPAFGNVTVDPKLSPYMSEALSRELVSRTHYTIVADPKQADATLYGNIVNRFTNATVSDPVTGRGSRANVIVQVQVRLVAKDGKVLFQRPNFQFTDRYEISVQPGQYIDESQATLQRLSRDLARSVVSAILENF